MNLSETFFTVLKSFKQNKLRSILTLLGIILGVACIITMISMTEINRKWVLGEFAKMGTTNIEGWYDPVSSKRQTKERISAEDIRAVLQLCYFVKRILPQIKTSVRATFGKNTEDFQVIGTDQDIHEVIDLDMGKGRFIVENDLRRSLPVCILGNEPREKLFGRRNPLQREILLQHGNRRLACRVIGYLAEDEGWALREYNGAILMPYTTVRNRLTGEKGFSSFVAQTDRLETVEYAEAQIKNVMEKREVPVRTWTPKEFLERNSEMSTKITLFGFMVSGVSLLIGGIGIMNIMLVSVMERIREIGIRRAVGASQKDILKQFLAESVFVGVVGGLIGVPLGAVGAVLSGKLFEAEEIMSFYSMISIPSVIIAFLFSAMISILFGYYPAKKAAGLDPIEALRYQ